MRRRERGTAVVEFALVAPILIAMICGIVDFSVAYTQRSQINQAAAAAARVYTIGLRDGDSDADAKSAAVARYAAEGTPSGGSATFSWSCVGANCVAATACPADPGDTPPTIILTVDEPRTSVTGLFNGLVSRVSGKGIALCAYDS